MCAMPRYRSFIAAGAVVVAMGLVAGFIPAKAFQPRASGRVEGTIVNIAYRGASATLSIQRDDGGAVQVRVPQYPAAQLELLVDLMNSQTRIVYEVADNTATDIFPTEISPRRGR